MMTNFVETAAEDRHGEAGWPNSTSFTPRNYGVYMNSTYVVAKIGWSALSRVQQRVLAADSRPDIVVNHVHPGYVDTDMTSHKGHLTVDQGAQSAVFAALLPPGTDIRGAYIWHDCQTVDWVSGPLPGVV